MFESQGLTVSRLIRTRFGKIELPPRLSRGKMMELSPDQVRSILAGAGMKDEAEAAMPAGRGARGARAGKPVREGQPQAQGKGQQGQGRRQGQAPGQGQGQGRQGGRPPREGNAGGDKLEPGNATDRPRRNRRGGKGARRDAMPAGAPNGAGNTTVPLQDEGFGNRVDSRSQIHQEVRGDAQPNFDGPNEVSGNAVDTAGNVSPGPVGERGPKPPGKNPRSRQRRNFRGRGGRNRGAKRGPGEGGPGEGGGTDDGGEGGNSGGGNDGNRGGNHGGGNTDGNTGGGNTGGGNTSGGGSEGNF